MPPDKENETLLKCVLLPAADFTQSTVNELSAHVFILEHHGNHYERIGMTRLPARFDRMRCFAPFFGFQNESGRVYAAYDELPSDVEKYIQSVMVDHWWWNYFEPDTIILG